MKMCVYCKRRYKKDGATSFHRFPTNLSVQKYWIHNMTATNWTPRKYDCLCSLHFDTECFVKHFNKIKLKPGSTPTIFEDTSTSPWSPCPSTSSSAISMGTSSVKRELFYGASVTEFTHESKSDQEQLTTDLDYLYEASSSTKKFSYDASVTVFTHKSKSDQQVTDQDYEASSSTKKFSGDASVTEFTHKSKSNQKQITHHVYEACSSPKRARIKIFGMLHDHCYDSTPRSLKKVTERAKRSLKLSKAKVKVLSQHVKRLKIKVANLKNVINDLV